MKALIIGGTGLISTGIVKHLRERGADITMYNRGQRENTVGREIHVINGDRNEFATFEKEMQSRRFDVVIDMICFSREQAESNVRAFGGKCEHLIFCSTVCTYGFKSPGSVLVDEEFPLQPTMEYGKNKVLCEQILMKAHVEKAFKTTVIRPSSTYGQGNSLLDNIEGNAVAWDRILKGKPVLCAGDGTTFWVSTHRDDCGKLFAYAALNPKTYGQCYNATRPRNFMWRDYYREGAAALGKTANLVFMPSSWIIKHDPKRFGLLADITQYHGAYDSSKARRDVPEFKCEIDFKEGAAMTFADMRRRNAWRNSDGDELYESMMQKALSAGVEPKEA